jgi:hypothetical protein
MILTVDIAVVLRRRIAAAAVSEDGGADGGGGGRAVRPGGNPSFVRSSTRSTPIKKAKQSSGLR